jgi:hypothetical protein
MVTELAKQTAERGLHGFPAAQTVGSRLAGLRNTAADLVLERNQALRLAVLDVEHIRILLGYCAMLAETRGDAALAEFHRRWETDLEEVEAGARTAAIEQGRDPQGAIEPAQPGALGRVGQRIGAAVGTAGEAIDASAAARAARRLGGR